MQPIDNSLNSNSSPSPDQSFNLNDPLLLSFAEDEVNYSNKRYFSKRSLSNSSIDFPSFGDQIDGGISSDQINLAEKAIISGNSQLALKLCSSILNDNAQDPRVFDLLSDAYLNLNKIDQAEVCLLHAVAIGGPSIKDISTCQFFDDRENFHLAEYYLTRQLQLILLLSIWFMFARCFPKRVGAKPYSMLKNGPN